MAERTVINRGPKGLNAAEQAYLAGEIDEPTFAKLYEGLQKPATDAATSLQQIGEQVEADAAAALDPVTGAIAKRVRFDAPQSLTGSEQATVRATVNAAVGTVQRSASGAVNRDLAGKVLESTSVFEFMSDAQIEDVVSGIGSLDVSAAIQEANADAKARNVQLDFPAGRYNVGTASFIIDASKAPWRGRGIAVLKWTAAPTAGFGVSIVGTGVYLDFWRGNRIGMSGFALLGGGNPGMYVATGLQIGDGTTVTNNLTVSNIAIQGFTTAGYYSENTWRITLEKVLSQWGNWDTTTTAANHGECMVLRECMFGDATAQWPNSFFKINKGNWKSYGCSFDNIPLIANNDAVVSIIGAHMEAPGSSKTDYYYVEVNNEAQVMIRDTWVIASSNANFIRSPFRCNTVDGSGVARPGCGLTLDGVCYIQNGTRLAMVPYTGYNCLAEGKGRVTYTNRQIAAFQNFQFLSVSKSGQIWRNGDFSRTQTATALTPVGGGSGTTTVRDWTQTIVGGGSGTVTISTSTDAADLVPGIASEPQVLKIRSQWTSGGSIGARLVQTVAIRPDELPACFFQYKTPIAGGFFTVKHEFLDSNLATISEDTIAPSNYTLGEWTPYRAGSRKAPGGAVWLRITIEALANSANPDNTFYVGNLLGNIIK